MRTILTVNNLAELAAYLKSLVPAVTLDSTFLPDRAVTAIEKDLGRSAGDIILAGVTAGNIQLSANGTILYIYAAQMPDSSDDAFLNLESSDKVTVRVDVAIWQTTPNDPRGFDLILRVTLPSGWVFSSSFPKLEGLPTDDLPIVGEQYFYFSTFTSVQPLPNFSTSTGTELVFAGNGGPASLTDTTNVLQEGLNYVSTIQLSGVFGLIVTILNGGSSVNFPFYGPVTSTKDGPTLDLRSPLPGFSSVKFGFIEVAGPWAGVKLAYVAPPPTNGDGRAGRGAARALPPPRRLLEGEVLPAGTGSDALVVAADDETKSPSTLVYLGTSITLNNQGYKTCDGASSLTLEIDAAFLQGSDAVLLSIAPTEGPASLVGITQLIGGAQVDYLWNLLPSDLQKILCNIAFKSFSAYFLPKQTSNPLVYVQVQVGTKQPWQLWGNWTLSLDLSWTVLFSGGTPSTAAVFEAVFLLPDAQKPLSFDIQVSIPDLLITGTQHGTVGPYRLSDLFNGLSLPVDLDVEFEGFQIVINKAKKQYSVSAVASAGLSLFGTEILSITDTLIQLGVDASSGTNKYSVLVNGIVGFGPIHVQVNAQFVSGGECILEMHLVNETVGSMLNHFIHLVDPTYDLTLPSPWDKILAINLDALVLKINLGQKEKNIPPSVTLSYDTSIDLVFLTITNISFTYTKSNDASSGVQVSLGCKFLGKEYGGKSGSPPLSWDPINEQPPQVPGTGSSTFDLVYLGVGQHVTFDSSILPKLITVEDVIDAMIKYVIPVQGKDAPKTGGDSGLVFSAASGWLFGADFTVLGTVTLEIIFNDPNLYGLLIKLAGERAGSFAGLKFEILYRKVTNDIGVYHIELKLPDAMRTLEFGQVSLTLPVIILDIYTNGNFRINLGFPKGLDFSDSFCLQILPFIGYGGFYFALLNGSTSSRVPKITNGTFNPVIEFGVGLSIGVGKTINKGVLSGGITVTVVGIVEGVVGFFNPTSSAVAKEQYYWLQGSITVVGRLYATINFGIIQASLDVTAYAGVTLIVEAHQPIYLSISAGVSVRLSVKIVFFTIHFSFSATVEASFTIGSATPTPWIVDHSSSGSNSAALRLPGQQTLHRSARQLAGHARAIRRERLLAALAGGPGLNWDPSYQAFPSIQPLTVSVFLGFTKSESTSEGANAILLFFVQNSIDPGAATLEEHQRLFGDDPASAEINLLLEGMLKWAIHARRSALGEDDSAVTADDLEYLLLALPEPATVEAAFNFSTLGGFIGSNYTVNVLPPADNTPQTGVAVFPALPVIIMQPAGGTEVDFWEKTRVDKAYQEKVTAYFAQLQVRYGQSGNGSAPTEAAAAGDRISMPTLIFEQYFAMLTRSAVQAARDTLTHYPVTASTVLPADDSRAFGLADIQTLDPTIAAMQVVVPNQGTAQILNTGTQIYLTDVVYQVRTGDSFALIASAFAAHGVTTVQGQPLAGADLAGANANAAGIFVANTPVSFANIAYSSQDNDTINLIATRMLLRSGPASVLQGIQQLTNFTTAVMQANTGQSQSPTAPIPPGTAITIPGSTVTYTTVAGDNFQLIAAYVLAQQQPVIDTTAVVQALLQQTSTTDPTAPLPAGTAITFPPITRLLQPGDSINSLATTLITTTLLVQATLLQFQPPPSASLLTPQAVLRLPPVLYAITDDDTLSGIGETFNLSLDQIGDAIAAPLPGQMVPPTVFNKDATVYVNDVSTVSVPTLIATLLGGDTKSEWNNISGMVSRFLLGGLRLPDPGDETVALLGAHQLAAPGVHDSVDTAALYALTGQQFPIAATPPSDYQVTLTLDSHAPKWLTLGGGSSLVIGLTPAQTALLAEIADTPLDPGIQWLTRLALYRMIPPRVALQEHLAWQAATLPGGCFGGTGQAAVHPSIWPFPDALIEQFTASGAQPLQEELVAGTDPDPLAPTTVSPVPCYSWGTLIDLVIRLPPSDGPAANSIANAYLVDGADQVGRNLLFSLLLYLRGNPKDQASIFLLYPPNPSGTNASGLASDQLDTANTVLIKTNLSTLTHSGPSGLFAASEANVDGPVYSAAIGSVRQFLQLLWECSIVGTGGYYLNYVNKNGNASLPGYLFDQGSSATISLLVLFDSQLTAGAFPPAYSFNNCAVVGSNLDASANNLFVQPLTYVASAAASFSDAATWYQTQTGIQYDPVDIAVWNAAIPQLLQIQAPLPTPQNPNYRIAYGDTLDRIAAAASTTVRALMTGANVTAPILAAGAQVQFAAQTANYPVPSGAGLADAATWYNTTFGAAVTPVDVAQLNATALVLLVNAVLAIPGQSQTYSIQTGDTLASIAAKFTTTIPALIACGSNASAAILQPGAVLQFARSNLRPAATVPPGNVGVELSRTNPDPQNANTLSAGDKVAELFHLLGYAIAESGTTPPFLPSGDGLPVTPATSHQDVAPGQNRNGKLVTSLATSVATLWNYQATVPVAPFSTVAQGSVSPALPPAAQNPYNGVGPTNSVTIDLTFRDIYGNAQSIAPPHNALPIPVGYYTDIIAINRWPSIGAHYQVSSGGSSPLFTVSLELDTGRYLPSSSLAPAAAGKAASGDAATYAEVYYQIQQSDLNFALETSLDERSLDSQPPVYPIAPKSPFTAFVDSAWVFLNAVKGLQQVAYPSSGSDTLSGLTGAPGLLGVTAGQLLTANGDQPYAAIFGTASLQVPVVHVVQAGDSLQSICQDPKYKQYNLDPVTLATQFGNAARPLTGDLDIVAPQRTYPVTDASFSMRQVAEAAACTVAALAAANHNVHGILQPNTQFAVGTVTCAVGQNDSLDDLVTAFAAKNITVTAPSLAAVNQDVAAVFVAQAKLAIMDVVVPSAGASLDQLSATYASDGFTPAALAQLNEELDNFFPAGTPLVVTTIPTPARAGVTLAEYLHTNTVTADQVAAVNGAATFAPNAKLDVPYLVSDPRPQQAVTYVTQPGDVLTAVAGHFTGVDPAALAEANHAVLGLFSPQQTLEDPDSKRSVTTDASDTFDSLVAKFAAENVAMTIDQLAAIIAPQTDLLAVGGVWFVTDQYSTYTAVGADTLDLIAGRYPDTQPVAIATLNQDRIGLFLGGQTVTDSGSKVSVPTTNESTFTSLLAAFAKQNVHLSLQTLANDIAPQTGLLAPGGVWICPPMVAANPGTGGAANTLAGLASKYSLYTGPAGTPTLNIAGLAQVNAAVQGFIAAGVQGLSYGGVQLPPTTAYDSFNSLVSRLAQAGVKATAADLAAAFEQVSGLLNPDSLVVPIPATTQAQVSVSPQFSTPIFPLTADIVMRRNTDWVDPDFATVPAVFQATTVLPPSPDQNDNESWSLVDFARTFETALPGLHVGTGTAVAEADPASARPLWVVNFGYAMGSTAIGYQFKGPDASYFALPPISTSLTSDQVDIQEYKSGEGLSEKTHSMSFQSIDLDVWMATFLEAVDLFLSPAYAVGAYGLNARQSDQKKPLLAVIEQKGKLATAIAGRVRNILRVSSGSPADAIEAMRQALLIRLSSAYTVNSMIQVPVAVTSPFGDAAVAPRLSGNCTVTPTAPAAQATAPIVNDYSLSTAKVQLAAGQSNATFLFTVKSPAESRQANLTLTYVISELEIPTPGAVTLDGYQASSWLSFIRPISGAHSGIGALEIPVPLRSYPPLPTVVEQTYQNAVETPHTPQDLAKWNFSCTYQHMDADQDTATLNVQFNISQVMALAVSEKTLFKALAQFIHVAPALLSDLATVQSLAPGTTNKTAEIAAQVFSDLVERVASAWQADAMLGAPLPSSYSFDLLRTKNPNNPDELGVLTLQPQKTNPSTPLWPVGVGVGQFNPEASEWQFQALTPQTQPPAAGWNYPPGVPTSANLRYQFTFGDLLITETEDARAGVSITRNAHLVSTPTSDAFIYQTPLVQFSGVTIPYLYSDRPFPIGPGPVQPGPLAAALGTFFLDLLAQGDKTLTGTDSIRVACSYGYELGSDGNGRQGVGLVGGLTSYVPVYLIPSYAFTLPTDYDPTNPQSFVSQLAGAICTWDKNNTPSQQSGVYSFDVSVYSGLASTSLQPLLRAARVEYAIQATR